MNNNRAEHLIKINNLKYTFWGHKIIEAEQHGGFCDYEKDLSNDWITCACGEVSKKITRNKISNAPTNFDIRQLGVEFNNFVHCNNFLGAAITLIEIEKTARKLENEKSK